MTIDVRQIREEDIGGFHAAVDLVAREHKYLALLEAPPMERASAFVRRNIEKGYPQFVALDDGNVVGWCNIPPATREVMAHVGDLFMGLLPRPGAGQAPAAGSPCGGGCLWIFARRARRLC